LDEPSRFSEARLIELINNNNKFQKN